MSGWWRSRRVRIAAGLGLLLGLVATFPLALAASWLGLKDMGVAARSLRGPVWWGAAEELTVAGVRLGTVDVFLDPLRLLVGQVRIDVARINGAPDDLVGGISLGWGARGVERLTGNLAIGLAFAPLPVNRAEFETFTVRFAGDLCVRAEGRVRVHVPALITGLDLANGLTGEARCEGAALVLPLAGQSGRERLELRVRADGAYEAVMRVRASDPALAAALAAGGFQAGEGDERLLRVRGTL